MKRTLIFTIAVVLSIGFFASTSNAQTTGAENKNTIKTNWVDVNADGLCDNVGASLQGSRQTSKGFGKRDGSGTAIRPQDGTGFGNKGGNATVLGVHDGTGPKGSSARRGGK